jgi:hypothetical protein
MAINVEAIELTPSGSRFLCQLNLASVPVPGPKTMVLAREEGGKVDFVFIVVEVHFANDGRVDVYLERVSSVLDYRPGISG